MSKKTILGTTEKVSVYGPSKKLVFLARIDTGATRSSIHAPLVKDLGLGPMLSTKKVKNANGTTIRPIINVKIKMKGKMVESEFTVTDRSHMKYKLLIGRTALIQGFMVDPSLNQEEG